MRQIQHLVANLSGNVRWETMEGRKYMVVPMVMAVETVMNGSNGPLYYPADELSKFPQVWNYKPVVVYHPMINGKGTSACDPVILDKHKIGVIMGARWDGGKLKAEAWVEEDRAKVVDDRVLNAIENGQTMELSIGLFADFEDVEGDFNGKTYEGVVRNIRPDHLAVLPDQIGACSIEDGAGFIRNELSHQDVWDQLQILIRESTKSDVADVWVMEVFESYFVYELKDKLYRQDYSITDDKVALQGVPEQVVRKYEYVVSNTTNSSEKENVMDREKVIGELIANDGRWTEDDKEFLEGMNDDQLKLLSEKPALEIHPATNDDQKDDSKSEPEDDSDAGDDKDGKTTPTTNQSADQKPKKMTIKEMIANATGDDREMLLEMQRAHAATKKTLINTITANEANTFSEDALKAMTLDQLRGVASIARGNKEEPTSNIDFSGLGDVPEGSTKEEPLEMPTINWANDSK